MVMKVTGVVWFNSGEAIGLVTVQTDFGESKAYIKSVTGLDMEDDIINIAEWGAKFPYDVAIKLVETMGEKIELLIED